MGDVYTSRESMAEVLLSEAERTFILHGVQDDLRSDGRGCEDYRHMELETDIVSNTNGSARLRLANTDILVGVKVEMGEPHPDSPNEGRLEFFVDCSANATPAFEGRGGEELATQISNLLTQAYSNGPCLDLASLCVIPRTQCWVLYIDILLLECGGNLFDAASIAARAAIFNTKIPRVSVTRGEKGESEIEISDDPYDCRRLDIANVPCIVTLNKIGHSHVVDASMQEEACSLARLQVGVTEAGKITAVNKDGCGSLQPASVLSMMKCGSRVGAKLAQLLRERLQEEEKLPKKSREKSGFLR